MIFCRCLIFLILIIGNYCNETKMQGKCLYFAYGSNLLAKRIHINVPNAVRAGIGKLEDYQLDFNKYSKRWHGCSATIAKRPGRHVWGAIWEINNDDLTALDRQEGVHENIYFRYKVDLILPDNTTKTCWVYEQTNIPFVTEHMARLPSSRQPSAVYLNTIIQGAVESNLPSEYQKFLQTIPHNGYNGAIDIGEQLHIV